MAGIVQRKCLFSLSALLIIPTNDMTTNQAKIVCCCVQQAYIGFLINSCLMMCCDFSPVKMSRDKYNSISKKIKSWTILISVLYGA